MEIATVRTLTTEFWLPQPLEEIFAFFSDAFNLDLLTPPWLHFRIQTPHPIAMRQGTRIDYRIRWRGLPLRWRTEIAAWEPPYRFVDQQIRGPYTHWVHEHTFESQAGGTILRDRVEYAVPGWIVAALLARFVVAPDVERIFAFRRAKIQELFAVQREPLA
jgi:ligand-binding SRPBCC domain-containing protein